MILHQIIASFVILLLQCIPSQSLTTPSTKAQGSISTSHKCDYTTPSFITIQHQLFCSHDRTSIKLYSSSSPSSLSPAPLHDSTNDIPTIPTPQNPSSLSCPKLASPGSAENARFRCDPSVTFWSEFCTDSGSVGDATTSQLGQITSVISPYLRSGDPATLAYWTSQLLRTGYFTTNAILGVVAHSVNQRLFRGNNGDNGDDEGRPTFVSAMVGSASRLLLEAVLVYEQDWRSICNDLLSPPWDAVLPVPTSKATPSPLSFPLAPTFRHRQSSPLFALTETVKVIRESVAVLDRRENAATPGAGVAPIEKADMYPNYYLNDFHYQTDGWLSARSAEVYEVSTETLFLGRQDAMQRRGIAALKTLLKDNNGGSQEAPKNILEVACGTGRLATFIREEFPKAEMTLSDLSPFYLEKARENDDYWRRTFQQRHGDQTGVVPHPATLVQANAEQLPFDSNVFDAVFCTYLFHELPDEAKVNAAAELARVVAPGGIVIFTDSNQLGDRPALDKTMGNFEKLNEPHYRNYIATDLPTLFERAGLECRDKFVASASKTLSFVKPVL